MRDNNIRGMAADLAKLRHFDLANKKIDVAIGQIDVAIGSLLNGKLDLNHPSHWGCLHAQENISEKLPVFAFENTKY